MTQNERRRPARAVASRDSRPTMIDEAQSTPEGAQHLAAARLAVNVSDVLRRALAACGLQQTDLAKRVGVSDGRISQVLADGNVRVATIGRYARALGYQPRLVLDPVESGLPAIAPRSRGTVTFSAAVKEDWRLLFQPHSVRPRQEAVAAVNFLWTGFGPHVGLVSTLSCSAKNVPSVADATSAESVLR